MLIDRKQFKFQLRYKVAIKILEKEKIVSAADVERVRREIHILQMLNHPNVVQVYEIIEHTSHIYLIMQYVSGGELFDYIVQSTRVKELEACKFMHQLIYGIDYIHQLGVAHRDLKPENLLISMPMKDLLIVDFGLSNTFKNEGLLKTACGSPCYAAPEMIAGRPYDGKSTDIWSCGVIMYALLCGYLPFEEDNTQLLYKKILTAEFHLPRFVSVEAKDLIRQILVVDPSNRATIEQIKSHNWMKLYKSEIVESSRDSIIKINCQMLPNSVYVKNAYESEDEYHSSLSTALQQKTEELENEIQPTSDIIISKEEEIVDPESPLILDPEILDPIILDPEIINPAILVNQISSRSQESFLAVPNIIINKQCSKHSLSKSKEIISLQLSQSVLEQLECNLKTPTNAIETRQILNSQSRESHTPINQTNTLHIIPRVSHQQSCPDPSTILTPTLKLVDQPSNHRLQTIGSQKQINTEMYPHSDKLKINDTSIYSIRQDNSAPLEISILVDLHKSPGIVSISDFEQIVDIQQQQEVSIKSIPSLIKQKKNTLHQIKGPGKNQRMEPALPRPHTSKPNNAQKPPLNNHINEKLVVKKPQSALESTKLIIKKPPIDKTSIIQIRTNQKRASQHQLVVDKIDYSFAKRVNSSHNTMAEKRMTPLGSVKDTSNPIVRTKRVAQVTDQTSIKSSPVKIIEHQPQKVEVKRVQKQDSKSSLDSIKSIKELIGQTQTQAQIQRFVEQLSTFNNVSQHVKRIEGMRPQSVKLLNNKFAIVQENHVGVYNMACTSTLPYKLILISIESYLKQIKMEHYESGPFEITCIYDKELKLIIQVKKISQIPMNILIFSFENNLTNLQLTEQILRNIKL